MESMIPIFKDIHTAATCASCQPAHGFWIPDQWLEALSEGEIEVDY